MESEEGGGDEIEVVDFVRREGSEPFREILGESKVWSKSKYYRKQHTSLVIEMISRCGWRMELCLNPALSSPSSSFKALNESKRGRQVMLKQSMMQGSVSLQRRGV